MPVNTLKNVVLPAPLGPMIDAIVPCSRSKSTSWSAVNPPNRLVTPLASRTAATSGLRRRPVLALERAVTPSGGEDALRAKDHHQDQDQAEDHALVFRRLELRRQVCEVEAEDHRAGVAQLVDPEREPLEHLK